MPPSYADMVQHLHTHTPPHTPLRSPLATLLLSEMRFRNPTKTDKTYAEIMILLQRKMLYGQPLLENFPGMYVHDSYDFCGDNKC